MLSQRTLGEELFFKNSSIRFELTGWLSAGIRVRTNTCAHASSTQKSLILYFILLNYKNMLSLYIIKKCKNLLNRSWLADLFRWRLNFYAVKRSRKIVRDFENTLVSLKSVKNKVFFIFYLFIKR